jgi:hypothetical protein
MCRELYRCNFFPVTPWAARAERNNRLRFSFFKVRQNSFGTFALLAKADTPQRG